MDYKYSPNYATALLAFFSQPAGKEETDDKGKIYWSANNLPTIDGFALEISVPPKVLHEWTEHHPEFKHAWDMAQVAQSEFLIQNTLRGAYNASFAGLVSKNLLGWSDSSKTYDPAGEQDGPSNKDPKEIARRLAFILNGRPDPVVAPENEDDKISDEQGDINGRSDDIIESVRG